MSIFSIPKRTKRNILWFGCSLRIWSHVSRYPLPLSPAVRGFQRWTHHARCRTRGFSACFRRTAG